MVFITDNIHSGKNYQRGGYGMKNEAWISALKAHAQAHVDIGSVAKVTAGEASKIMGCSVQTARKHLKKAANDGSVSGYFGFARGACVEYVFTWTV